MAFRKVTKLSLPVCLSLGLIGAANASSFTNGDFESPNIGDVFYNTYGNTSTGITGWTVVAPGGNVAIIGAGAGANYPAESGSQWIDLTGTGGTGQGLTQAFDTTSGRFLFSFLLGGFRAAGRQRD